MFVKIIVVLCDLCHCKSTWPIAALYRCKTLSGLHTRQRLITIYWAIIYNNFLQYVKFNNAYCSIIGDLCYAIRYSPALTCKYIFIIVVYHHHVGTTLVTRKAYYLCYTMSSILEKISCDFENTRVCLRSELRDSKIMLIINRYKLYYIFNCQ